MAGKGRVNTGQLLNEKNNIIVKIVGARVFSHALGKSLSNDIFYDSVGDKRIIETLEL